MKIAKFLGAVATALLLTSGSGRAASQVVVGGELIGARDVDVAGVLYNVSFESLSCVELFDGCDEASDFAFSTFQDARAASIALNNQVFFDGPLGDFDSNPELTRGITRSQGTMATIFGFSETPGSVDYSNFVNGDGTQGNPDFDRGARSIGINQTPNGLITFAKWEVAAVPVPAGGLLLVTGLAGLAAFRRRRRAA